MSHALTISSTLTIVGIIVVVVSLTIYSGAQGGLRCWQEATASRVAAEARAMVGASMQVLPLLRIRMPPQFA